MKGIQTLIIALVVIGIVLGIGLLVLTEFQDKTYATGTAGTVANETVTTPTTSVGSHLASVNLRDGACGTITSILNGTTGNVVIGLGNFTQTDCKIVNTTSMAPYSSSIRISYPYTYSANTSSSEAIDSTNSAISEIPAWLTIVVIIAIVGLLLAIVFKVMGNSENGAGYSFGSKSESGLTASI